MHHSSFIIHNCPMAPFLSAGPFSARNGEGRQLFSDVSIEINDGELAVLDGPSGSGKSTLLRQLVGMVPTPDLRRELAAETFAGLQLPRWRSRVTLVAQDAPMLAGTLGDNIRFPFAQRCAGRGAADETRLRELLEATGLAGIPEERNIGTLSGGERHRLALVRGLLWDPPVLVADEPLSGLDEERSKACFSLLLDFAHRPEHAVICVLHDRALAARADRRMPLVSVSAEVRA
jgi:putative ABC transport system ATP-binding protein